MSSTSDKITGQVKWFNNKTGYGFITVNDGEHKGKDIFTHYSAISVNNSQYKYLVQGEYVELGLVKPETGDHEYQAVDVSGIKGGQLMCEVRFSQQSASRGKTSKGKRSNSTSESQQESA